jgi:hypothetical protein
MRNCYDNNRDGAGLAWADEDGLHVEKGYFSWDGLWKDMRELRPYPTVLHCRLATHGSVSAENCHPFLLRNGVAVAHNGVIHMTSLEKDMTDSESFAIKHIEPWTWDELQSDRVTDLLEMAMGAVNIIAMLGGDGRIALLNGDKGEDFEGVWFSNASYARSYRDLYEGYYRAAWARLSKGKASTPKEARAECDYYDSVSKRCALTDDWTLPRLVDSIKRPILSETY